MNHQDHLDGWRGLAVSLVLVEHFVDPPWISAGRLGVDLFFVLSGLLMSRLLFEERVPLKTFYFRRASRILPAFLVYVFAAFLVWGAYGQRVTLREALATITFLRTYFDPFIWSSQFPIGHLWSLNVEEHSYVLLATVAAITPLRNKAGTVLIGCALLTFVAIAVYLATSPRPTEQWALRTECAAGALLLSAGYRQIGAHWKVPKWAPALALVLGMLCYLTEAPRVAKVGFAPFLLAFAVNHIGATYDYVLALFRSRPARQMGLWSYSLYLWQQPFYILHTRHGLAAPLGLVFGFMCALGSFYWLEKPLRTQLNKAWDALRQSKPAVLREPV